MSWGVCVLGIERRALHLLSKPSTTKLNPQPQNEFLIQLSDKIHKCLSQKTWIIQVQNLHHLLHYTKQIMIVS